MLCCLVVNLWENKELMLCKGLVPQPRDETISQTKIEPANYYCNNVQHLTHPGTIYGTEMLGSIYL